MQKETYEVTSEIDELTSHYNEISISLKKAKEVLESYKISTGYSSPPNKKKARQ